MKKQLLLLLFGLSAMSGYSQEVAWERSIGGSHSEYLFDMTPTVDYGFILAGSSLSDKTGDKAESGSGNLDYFIWKMDKHGEEEWQMSFGADGADLLQKIIPADDMGYLLAGTSNSGIGGVKSEESRGKNDLWLIKINAKGAIEWEKTIGGSGDDKLMSVTRLDDGYIVGAASNSPVSGEKTDKSKGGMDIWLIRLDKTGKILWQKTYGGYYNDEVKKILPTERGFIVLSESNSPAGEDKNLDNLGSTDIWVLQLDNSGNLRSQYVFGGEGDDRATDILPTESGYIITGSKQEDDNRQFWVMQTDKQLMETDSFIHEFSGDAFMTDTFLDENGTLLLSGYNMDLKTRKKSYLSVKTNLSGDKLWDKELSTSGDDLLRKVVKTRDGGYVFAGNSNGTKAKIKSSNQGGYDYWVLKLHNEEEIKTPGIKLEAIPNPTENFTQIVLNHDYEYGELMIVDMTGKILYREALQYDMATLDFSTYPRGVYVVTVKTDVMESSVKVIKK